MEKCKMREELPILEEAGEFCDANENMESHYEKKAEFGLFHPQFSGPIHVKTTNFVRQILDRTQEFFEGGKLKFNMKIWNYKENRYEGIWNEKLGRERKGRLQLSRT
ncbi:hypothetical protein WR25_23320 [Diploscapter pachys]|uniref:Uncharacterized protein n=1 Tax=Diploscapter pachys TaxID=2018661 RepID=A0A2A2J7E8_9BILA|nr:hypothetical protein WR25_23320 [Diploscapter pachys]